MSAFELRLVEVAMRVYEAGAYYLALTIDNLS